MDVLEIYAKFLEGMEGLLTRPCYSMRHYVMKGARDGW